MGSRHRQRSGRGAHRKPRRAAERNGAVRPLWRCWPEVEKRLSKDRPKLLFLDFDGTLAPIVRDPARASASSATLSALSRLAKKKDWHVVIISGRALSDLKARVRSKKVH